MFGTVLIIACTLMHFYVFFRAASVPFVKRRIPRKALFGIGLALWTLFYLGRVMVHGGTGFTAAAIEMLGMNWMAALFLISVSLLFVDLVTLFGLIFRRIAPYLRGYALIAGFFLSTAALFQGLRPPVIQTHEVGLEGLPEELDGTVVIAISDTHIGSLLGERWLADRIDQVRRERPDMVVLLGDIFEGHGKPLRELTSTLRGLRAPLGVWAVSGNHDFYRDRDEITALMEEANIHILQNHWVRVRPGLIVAGVDDLTRLRRIENGGHLVSRALEGRPPGATIFLSHTPWHTDKAAQAGAGLMLSGHTHGGQIWPFGYLVRLAYPLLGGRYEMDGMTVIVCRGTGTWGPRMRLWSPGEILRITLRCKDVNQYMGQSVL